jgi:hypothetical protein
MNTHKQDADGIIRLHNEGHDKDVVDEFYRWATGITKDNFHALLFLLIQKADKGNRYRLQQGFPLEVKLVSRYADELGWWEAFVPAYLASRGEKNGKVKNH